MTHRAITPVLATATALALTATLSACGGSSSGGPSSAAPGDAASTIVVTSPPMTDATVVPAPTGDTSSTGMTAGAGDTTAAAPPSSTESTPVDAPSDGKEFYRKVNEAVGSAKSVRLVGSVQSGLDNVVFDLAGRTDGSNEQDIVTLGKTKLTVLRINGKSYLKAPAQFHDSKFHVTPKSADESIKKMSVSELMKQMAKDDESTCPRPSRESVEGRDVFVCKAFNGVAHVLADGSYRPVYMKLSIPQRIEVRFLDWDGAKTFTAPTGAQLAR